MLWYDYRLISGCDYKREPQKLREELALFYFFCPGLTQSVLVLLCCFSSVACFPFLLCCLGVSSWVTSRTRWCHIDNSRTFTSRTDCWEIHRHFTWLFLFNMNVTVRGMNIYIHMYIQTLLAISSLMWGSLRLAPIRPASQFPHKAVVVLLAIPCCYIETTILVVLAHYSLLIIVVDIGMQLSHRRLSIH